MKKAILVLWLFHASLLFGQSSYDTSPSGQTGGRVLGSYFSSDIDSVSLTNGNLHLNIPLFSLPGREFPLRLNLDYNSQFFEQRTVIDPDGVPQQIMEFLGWRQDAGIGGTLTGTQTGGGNNWQLDVYWIEANGTKHRFSKSYYTCCPNAFMLDHQVFDSTESDFLRIDTGNYFSGASYPDPDQPVAPAKLWFKNGNYIIFEPGSGSPARWTLRTTNGNQLAVTGTATSTSTVNGNWLYDVVPLNDTIGRSISYSVSGLQVTVTLRDSNDQPKLYRYAYSTLSGVPVPNSSSTMSMRVITSIVLPNGRSYALEYNSNGYLSKLTFPSGAYIRYSYWRPTLSCTGWVGKWHVSSRTVSADGTAASEKTTNYSYSYIQNCDEPFNESLGPIDSVTATDPTGGQVVHTFSSNLQTVVENKNGTGTTLKKVETTWNTSGNARVTTVKTTIGNRVRQTMYAYDAYNNVTSADDYDFGLNAVGPRLRAVNRSYADWSADHVLDRILTERVSTADGIDIAKTEWVYDDYAAQPLVNRTGSIPLWNNPGSGSRRGNVTANKRWLNTSNTWFVTGQQYDVLGNLVKVTDPGGHATPEHHRSVRLLRRHHVRLQHRTAPPGDRRARPHYDDHV